MSSLQGTGAPVPPIAIEGGADDARAHLATLPVELSDDFMLRLGSVCGELSTIASERAESSRDWWPLAMVWARAGEVPAIPAVIARPRTAGEVAEILSLCSADGVPVTPSAGRSGVCGSAVPVHGGVVLDLTRMAGIVDADTTSGLVDVLPGTFGDRFEDSLRAEHGMTVGHWPQSMAISTVGGWLACRGAGQYSTRYGKIEDIVDGLEVALADGRVIRTGGRGPRAAAGPDLSQLFVGSEGTLGVITEARLRAHPLPEHESRSAWSFPSFTDGLEVCRRILRRGATPAVLRLYDGRESKRSYELDGEQCALVVLDEGDGTIVEAMMAVIADECGGGTRLDDALVEQWLGHRNDVSGLEAAISRDVVVDTCEISASWGNLPRIYADAIAAVRAVPGTWTASAHQSHSYIDGACLYFTFAGQPTDGATADDYYRAAWDAMTTATLAAGGALSHHHGVGLNRARFMADALDGALDVLAAIKGTLDPAGVLNPGKLGLPSRFGAPAWP